MSKIGKQPIILPDAVTVEISGDTVSVTGPKGTISREFSSKVNVEQEGGAIVVSIGKNITKETMALWGTTRALIANMVLGVTDGWTKQLELVGTGFRAETVGSTLVLTLGFSHPVKIDAPEGITFKVEKSVITIEGIDKDLVGRLAAAIRRIKPPEPYKGKGVKYVDEVIRRKPGKAAAKAVTA
jgi:large subunit ribosomal protein L6